MLAGQEALSSAGGSGTGHHHLELCLEKWFTKKFGESCVEQRVWVCRFGVMMRRAWRVRFAAEEEKLSPDLGEEQVLVWERLVSYWVTRGEGSVPLLPCPASIRCLWVLCFLAAALPLLPLTSGMLGCVTFCFREKVSPAAFRNLGVGRSCYSHRFVPLYQLIPSSAGHVASSCSLWSSSGC